MCSHISFNIHSDTFYLFFRRGDQQVNNIKKKNKVVYFVMDITEVVVSKTFLILLLLTLCNA